jgi:tripartite motif-containing protein 71
VVLGGDRSTRHAVRVAVPFLILAASLVIQTAIAHAAPRYRLVRQLGGPLHAEMYPSGLEVAPNGDLIIADTGNNQVARYAPDGTQRWRIGTQGTGRGRFMNPRDVGVGADGVIYVADPRNNRIVRLSGRGEWLGSFSGPSFDSISFPMGVTATRGKVYVADAGKNKIRVFDRVGNQLLAFGSSGACQLAAPRDVDADAQGNIYVANYTANNIAKFGPNGACLFTWGTNGTGPTQFKTPYGIRIARDPVLGTQAVYVADGNNNQLKEFTLNGAFVAAFGSTGAPSQSGTFTELRRVAVEADGDVWGADLWGWAIERFERTAGGYSYAGKIGRRLPAATPSRVFHETMQVALVGDGTAWVVDRVHHRVVHLRIGTGEILRVCGERGFLTGFFNWPEGIAIDPATGQLWVTNTKQYNIHVLRPDCSGVARFGAFGADLGEYDWPGAIAIRPSDRIAFVADNKNDRVVAIDVATRVAIGSFGTEGSGVGQFSDPMGLGVAPGTGRIYVADTLNDRIVELASPDGVSYSVVRTIASGFKRPTGVAVDELGRLYVADSGNDRVVVLRPDGTRLATIDAGGRLDEPHQVAVDGRGRVFISDTYHDRVLLFRR